jgi:hypothetical protein
VPVFILLYGWQIVDLAEWRTLTAAPFTLGLDPSRQFLYGSPFSYLLGAYYQRQGLGFLDSFVVVHGIGLLLLAYAAVRALRAGCGADHWGAGALLVAASPLLLTVTLWIGKDDTFLLAFYLFMLSTKSSVTRALLGALMVLCHRELGTAMLVAHVLVRRDGAAAIAGAAAGLIVSMVYTNVLMNAAPATRMEYALTHARGIAARVFANPVIYFAAALGPFWIYVLRPSALTVARIVVLMMAAALAAMTLDFTRIFVLVSVPLLLVVTEDLVAELRDTGGIWLAGRRWPVGVLGILALTQVHLSGDRLSSLGGLVWTVKP